MPRGVKNGEYLETISWKIAIFVPREYSLALSLYQKKSKGINY